MVEALREKVVDADARVTALVRRINEMEGPLAGLDLGEGGGTKEKCQAADGRSPDVHGESLLQQIGSHFDQDLVDPDVQRDGPHRESGTRVLRPDHV